MIIDARSLPSHETLEADVCIVGAGPAGITLAREFINQKGSVLLIESGGLEFDAEAQSFSEGTVVGDRYPDLGETRLRQLGGTAHYWEAPSGYKQFGWRCLPLDEIDFEQRDWLPHSGWPFPKSHLDPFYQRAHQVCQIGPFTYRVEDWEQPSAQRLPFAGDRITTTMSQYASRVPFTEEYRHDIQRSSNITTLLHATVTAIETDETARTVTRLQVNATSTKQFWVSAKLFVLATGGIENARLLLLSNQVQQMGLGNQHDLVGRFFMDRPIVSCGMLIPKNSNLFDQTGLYDIRRVKGVPVMARMQLTEETMRREQVMNNGAQLFPRPYPHQKEATQTLKALMAAIRDRKQSEDLLRQAQMILNSADYVAATTFWAALKRIPGLQRGNWSYLAYEKRRFAMFEVIYQIEQAPHPNNRVLLSVECDRLQQNKVEIQWRLHEIDYRTIQRVTDIWAEEFERSGLGTLQRHTELTFDNPAMHHHMGTTRMHRDPKQGVVDANCKVHDMENLFIAGSSVFPTAGYANPTLTIIALTLRLADHIKTLL